MAKRRKPDSAPKSPKMKHFSRPFAEDSRSAIETLLDDCVEHSKRIYRHMQVDDDFITGRFGKRRAEAIRRSLGTVIPKYNLTERTRGLIPTAEIWARLNFYTKITWERIDENSHVLLAVALWLLDHIDDTPELMDISHQVDFEEDWDLPYFYDLKYGEELVQSVVYILRHCTASEHYILDVDSRPGPTAEACRALVRLVSADDLRAAVSAFEEHFWTWTDAFFTMQYHLAERYISAVAEYDRQIDRVNEEGERFDAMKRSLKQTTPLPARRPPAKAGSPVMSDLRPLPPVPAPAAHSLNWLPMYDSDSMVDQLEAQSDLVVSAAQRADELSEAVYDRYLDMLGLCLDFKGMGLSDIDSYKSDLSGLSLPKYAIQRPYEILTGFFLLASPDAVSFIYDEVPAAAELPWLLGASSGLILDAASHLPWGIAEFDMDALDFKSPRKPLTHPDWYSRDYGDGDGERRNLAQIVYEITGSLLPRDMASCDDAHSMLLHYGIRGKKEVQLLEMMTALESSQYRMERWSSSDEEEPLEEEIAAAEADVEAVRAQLQEARAQLKRMTDVAHEQERRARKAEAALTAERERVKSELMELAGLREVVFAAQKPPADDRISISLPYAVQSRTVIFGGHDMWQKPMKEYLTGDVRFIDRDMAAFDTDVIRNADVVWIQTNAIPHKQYYKIMDAARKWKIPVAYFLYASARKCAEQLALYEQRN